MSVGSAGKWLAMGLLVAALGATGCKDDDGDDENGGPTDSGTQQDTGTGKQDAGGGGDDAGKTDSGAADAGAGCPDNPGLNNACCGADKMTLCTFHTLSNGAAVKAGCALSESDAEVCGISSENVLGPDGSVPFMEKNAPGKESPSCGMFYDSLEMADAGGIPGNGRIDVARMISGIPVKLSYPGCCTPAGFCSIDGKMGTADIGTGPNPSDNGYGCMKSIYAFWRNPEFGPAGTPIAGLPLRKMPCDPTTGMIMIPGTDGGAGTDGGTDAGTDGGASDAGADGGNG